MAINIRHWNTHKLAGLKFDIGLLYNVENKKYQPDPPVLIDIVLKSVRIDCPGGEILGTLKDTELSVSNISISDDGSAVFYHDILLPALLKSKGTIKATIHWETSEIEKLHLHNGKRIEDPL